MNFLKKILGGTDNEPGELVLLLEEQSPNCPLTATVEQDNRTAYLYIWGPEDSPYQMKACWIRNLRQAPKKVSRSEMKKGLPPMMPAENCKNPDGLPALEQQALHLVWLEEGDGVALLENNQVIAIIPSWGGVGGFPGYAAAVKGQGEFAWELKPDMEILGRVQESQRFRKLWEQEADPFYERQPMILEEYRELFGHSEKYFAIDTETGMPCGLYVRNGERHTVFGTVGMSLFPMPVAEMYTEDRFSLHRTELGMIINAVGHEHDLQNIAEWFSSTSSLPWSHITFLAEGHTVSFDAFSHPAFKSALLTRQVRQLPQVQLQPYRGSVTNFYWLVPITEKERDFAMENGSEKLVEKLNLAGEEIYSLDRKELV